MKILLFLSLMLSLFATVCPGGPSLPLSSGETFTYRVGWEIFRNAGEVKISAQNQNRVGSPELRLTTTTTTRGIIHLLYPFEATAESIFDTHNGRLLSTHASATAGHKRTEASMTLDYAHDTANYTDRLHPERNKPALVIPSGNPADLITSLVQARAYMMKPGDKIPALVLFDDEFYQITIAADHYEFIRTPLGEFETLVLIPRMEKDPKGMFRKGGQIRVWITQDSRHLPVQLEVKLKFGTALARLTEYTPPVTPVAVVIPKAAPRHS